MSRASSTTRCRSACRSWSSTRRSPTTSRSQYSGPRRSRDVSEQDWNFPQFEEPLHEVFPQLHGAQNAWLAQLESLSAPDRNRDFWTAGVRGELRFWRCRHDGFYIHPWQPICPVCHSKDLQTEPVSGKATVASFSINYQPWMPGPELPYVVAIIEIVEQPG